MTQAEKQSAVYLSFLTAFYVEVCIIADVYAAELNDNALNTVVACGTIVMFVKAVDMWRELILSVKSSK